MLSLFLALWPVSFNKESRVKLFSQVGWLFLALEFTPLPVLVPHFLPELSFDVDWFSPFNSLSAY